MEIDNLEWQLIIDYRLKNYEEIRLLKGKQVTVECQTELELENLKDREQLLEFKEKELQI